MTNHLFSLYGEFISDETVRKAQMRYFLDRLHPMMPDTPVYMSETGEASTKDNAAFVSLADYMTMTDVESMSMETATRVHGIFLISRIVGVNGKEAEDLCVRIYRDIDEVYDGFNPYTRGRFPELALSVLYGNALGKYIQYSDPICLSDSRLVKLHRLLCLKFRSRFNNMFRDLGIGAQEELCGDGIIGMCRIPGSYCTETERFPTIFGTHTMSYPIKAICKYVNVDFELSEEQIDELIKREEEDPEYIGGLFVQQHKEKEDEEKEIKEQNEPEDQGDCEIIDESGWNEEKAVASMYEAMDDRPWGKGFYIQNSIIYEGKLRSYIKKHPDRWSDSKMKFKVVGIYYSFCRAHMSLRVSICYTIGLNSLFSKPLTNEEFYDALKYAEQGNRDSRIYSINGNGRFFAPDRILHELGVSTDEIRIGVRAQRRKKTQDKAENEQIRETRIRELFLAGMTTATDIARALEQEGIKKCGVRTVQKLLIEFKLR